MFLHRPTVGYCILSATKTLPRLLIIAGPTASGKSKLALDVADRLNGIVINADSMQVYREMRILTARPSPEDEGRVSHRLYGVLSVTERCSVGLWREMAIREIEKAWNDVKLPVVVGGTGLYLKVLLGGISKIPEVKPEIRNKVMLFHDKIGPKAFHAELAKVDFEAAERLHEADTQRLTRAYEVYLATGTPLSSWHQYASTTQSINADVQTLVLQPPREGLYNTCNERFETMLEGGALDEVRGLMKLQLDPSMPVMKALGVLELLSYIKGEISFEQAKDDAKRATRNYAKRQMTWFRNQNEKANYIFAQYSERILDKIFSKIRF